MLIMEEANLRIMGKLVDVLVNMHPDTYIKYVVYEKDRKVLYVEILQALYGILEVALLWYNMFRADLEAEGFEFNPYDPCVANKQVKGKQLTIRFHVDDLMSSHIDPTVNDEFLKFLNHKYGTHAEVKATRGGTHDYLWVMFTFRDGELIVDMVDYVKSMLKEFQTNLKTTRQQ